MKKSCYSMPVLVALWDVWVDWSGQLWTGSLLAVCIYLIGTCESAIIIYFLKRCLRWRL